MAGDKQGTYILQCNAYVCVEVDTLRHLSSKILPLFNGSTNIQKAMYLNLPNCCIVCFSLTPFIKDCPLHKKEHSFISPKKTSTETPMPSKAPPKHSEDT